jgi:hypothetical protein
VTDLAAAAIVTGEASGLVLVTTRMRFRNPVAAAQAYVRHRKLKSLARSATPGLLHSAFLVAGPRTVVTLSVWTSRASIEQFQASCAFVHGPAARFAFFNADERWSASAEHVTISPSANQWT